MSALREIFRYAKNDTHRGFRFRNRFRCKKPLSDQNVRALRFLKSLYRREKISLSDLKTPFLGLAKNDVLLLV